MFILFECILFILIILYDLSLLKYISVSLCFLYLLFHRIFDKCLAIILIADYFLLFTNHYNIGVLLFIVVQCLYHRLLSDNTSFYYLALGILLMRLEALSVVYALMSLINICESYKTKHSLFRVLLLLALCDICVALQFVFKISIPFIWIFYLPSQVLYTKMVLSMKIKPLQRQTNE